MKKLILILFICLSGITQAQNSNEILNSFQYAYVIDLVYENNSVDDWGISEKVRSTLGRTGIQIIRKEDNLKALYKKMEHYKIVFVYINHSPICYGCGTKKVTIQFTTFDREIVLTKSGEGVCLTSLQCEIDKATDRALSSIKKFNHQFDSAKSFQPQYPVVERLDESEATLKDYLSRTSIDELEGIYKSYQSENLGYYKFGIKRFNNVYKAIIIDSDNTIWKSGDVKAIFEPSSMKGFYSTKWYMGDKTTFETFSLLESSSLLSIEFKNLESGEKRNDKFIKLYPTAKENSSVSIDGMKSTGSGFVVSTDGVIATNAHVVENADKIEIFFNNEFGTKKYSASVLLKDESNDVALLKIDDTEFKGFNSLPYSILQNTEIGEDVFTIGYPLNTLMGDNYKVTNGIISSNSGLRDDIRFMQITAPIQPGNSGGPLFNKDGNIVGLTTSKLNERAVGTSIENVNYAIKATYLINIYNMLPVKEQLSINRALSNKDLKDQVKILKNYVCLIKIY